MDLALNNLQRLIRHKTEQTKPNHLRSEKKVFFSFPTCLSNKAIAQCKFAQ